jgi:hypothetical protein
MNNKEKKLNVNDPVDDGRREDLFPLLLLDSAAVHVIAEMTHDTVAGWHLQTPRARLNFQRHVMTHVDDI